MEEIILNAFERTVDHKKFREVGFIAGVIYGDSVKEATSVKFEELSLKKLLKKHGSNAKVWVKLGEDKKFGFIKEIQRHPVTAVITHIDVQTVSQNHEIKMQIPIAFKNEDSLIVKQLQLQIHKAVIDVFGKMTLMPDSVSVDLAEKVAGDAITINEFDLNKDLKVNDKEDEIYAVVIEVKVQEEEEEVVEDGTVEAVVTEPTA